MVKDASIEIHVSSASDSERICWRAETFLGNVLVPGMESRPQDVLNLLQRSILNHPEHATILGILLSGPLLTNEHELPFTVYEQGWT